MPQLLTLQTRYSLGRQSWQCSFFRSLLTPKAPETANEAEYGEGSVVSFFSHSWNYSPAAESTKVHVAVQKGAETPGPEESAWEWFHFIITSRFSKWEEKYR